MFNTTPAAACTEPVRPFGLTPYQLRGIRLVEGEGGANPATSTEPPEGQDDDTGADQPPEGESADGADGASENASAFDAKASLAKIRKLNSENKNLRKRATDAEAAAKEHITGLESENARLKVALKQRLPLELAERLKGSTEEEILQDAESLMSVFETKKPPTDQPTPRLRGGGEPTQPDDPTLDVEKLAAGIFSN